MEACNLELVEQVADDRHVALEGVAQAAHLAEVGAFLAGDITDLQVLAYADTFVGVYAESKEEGFLSLGDVQGLSPEEYLQVR